MPTYRGLCQTTSHPPTAHYYWLWLSRGTHEKWPQLKSTQKGAVFLYNSPVRKRTQEPQSESVFYVRCKVTAAFMPIYLCFGRRPSQSESRRSATCHNKRRNAHHHKRAMASPRYSTRARVRDCAPTNNTHPTTQRRRRRRRRRARHRRFRPITAGRSSCRGFMVAWRECVRSTDERGSWLCVCVAEKPR